MDSKHIIISENPRPLCQILIASLFFTGAFALVILFFYQKWNSIDGKSITRLVDAISYLIVIGITSFLVAATTASNSTVDVVGPSTP